MSGASDPDVPLSNNNIQETSEAQQIGVPLKNFNIHQSVFFTHGYFKKVNLADDEARAQCMICWIEDKKKSLYKLTDGSTKGL